MGLGTSYVAAVTCAAALTAPSAFAQTAPPPSASARPAPQPDGAGVPTPAMPPRTAQQAGEGKTTTTDAWGRNLSPFGPGVPVQITSTGKFRSVSVYVARAVELRYRPTDYDFVEVGTTPVDFQLPPSANYWIEVESQEVQRGAMVLRVDEAPKHIEVSPGRAGVRGLGTLSLAVGITAALGGAIVYATGSNAETDFNETAIAAPLLAVGGAGIVLGIVAYRVSRTKLTDPDDPAKHADGSHSGTHHAAGVVFRTAF